MKASLNSIRANDTNFASPHFGRLSPQQCGKLHNASLEILERTGVRLFEPEAVEMLRKAGAFISEDNRVRIPAGLVEKAFSTVPRRVVLCNRHGERVIFLEDHRSFYGPGSDCLHLMDHRTGARRQPVLQDVVEGITVCDALAHIDFVMSLVLPGDVNQAIAERYQMEAMLSYTTKPVVFVTYDFEGCVDAVEMAEAVVGGPDALRQNPLVACYINVTTGLKHNAEALQKLLYLAGKGLPAIYVPVVSGERPDRSRWLGIWRWLTQASLRGLSFRNSSGKERRLSCPAGAARLWTCERWSGHIVRPIFGEWQWRWPTTTICLPLAMLAPANRNWSTRRPVRRQC